MARKKLPADEAIHQISEVLEEADTEFIQNVYDFVCNREHEIVSVLEFNESERSDE